MKKNRKIMIVILISLFVLLVPLISYRVWNLCLYNIGDSNVTTIIEKFVDADYVTIYYSDYQGKYLEFDNMKVADEFDSFLLISESHDSRMYSSINKTEGFSIGKTINEISNLREVNQFCINCVKDIENIIKKNNLETDVDLFNYLKSYKFNKSSIFSSTDKIKNDFIVDQYVNLFLPSLSSITYIKGDYSGYMYETNGDNYNIYNVVLEKGNSNYFLVFIDIDNFSKNDVYNMISTVVIE